MRGAGARRIAALAQVALVAAGPAAAESPRVLYMLHCQGCHLSDGSGKPGEVPSLMGTLGRFVTVPGGRAFLVQVPGSAQSPLGDAELASVLNWMLASFGSRADSSAFVPYDAAEVARHRSTPLVDVAAARAELVRQLGQRSHLEGKDPSRKPLSGDRGRPPGSRGTPGRVSSARQLPGGGR